MMRPERTISVLVLEDDADDYRLVARQLDRERPAFHLAWAETLDAAREQLRQSSVDVILTDLCVPDSTGLETVAALRREAHDTPIIVLTELDDDVIEHRILAAGAQDYLVKRELVGRHAARAIWHAVQRQELLNEKLKTLRKLERSRRLAKEQAALLRRKNRRLRQLYKTAQEFVDHVSHDLRTPLTVIKDYVAIIREGMAGPINDEQRAMLDKVSVRADDLNNMVDDLLDVSKLEAGLLGGWRRNTHLPEIIRRTESMLQQRAAVKDITLVSECPDDLPDVYCDADKITRVLTNLAVNAIKFTDEGGQVRIWAKADSPNQQVIVGVSDNGRGIEPDAIKQIFRRFRQLHHAGPARSKGFGLGLCIARQLCEVNLGEMSVESEPGRGSTFTFTLPVAEPLSVVRRWLRQQVTHGLPLQLSDITAESSTDDASQDEFDCFLNCLLRRDDLLFRVAAGRWLLLQAMPSYESTEWFRRVRAEFERDNRNRPFGRLPDYHAEIACQWSVYQPHEEILRDFASVLDQQSTARQQPMVDVLSAEPVVAG